MSETWNDCERCGAKSGQNVISQATLYGGYEAALCNACRNDWTATLSTSDLWREVEAIDAKRAWFELRANAKEVVPEDEVSTLLDSLNKARQQAFAAAVGWMKSGQVQA